LFSNSSHSSSTRQLQQMTYTEYRFLSVFFHFGITLVSISILFSFCNERFYSVFVSKIIFLFVLVTLEKTELFSVFILFQVTKKSLLLLHA